MPRRIIRAGGMSRRRKVAKFPIFIILFLVVSLGCIVMAMVQGKNIVDSGMNVSDKESETTSSQVISDIALTESSISSEAPSSQPEPQQAEYGVPVPESERVTSAYFNDAAFFGDSVTDGISIYSEMSNAKVIAYTGINPSTSLTKEVIKYKDTKISMLEALKNAAPKKIYIMIGINSIGMEKASFVKSYAKMLDGIKAQHPDAIIYVQPITPITAKYEADTKRNTYNITNAQIDEYNAEIQKLAGEKEMYYINILEVLKDDTGALPDEASPKDGIHFGKKYYDIWFEYLRTHTV